MDFCAQTSLVQDYLDDELVPAERLAFEAHLAGCRACTIELAAFQQVFGTLEALPTWDPGPQFADRVVAAAFPARQAAWSRTLGYAYAACLAASIGALGMAFVLPGPRAWAIDLIGAGTHAVVLSLAFVLRACSAAIASVVDAFGSGGDAIWRTSPIVRALLASLTQPLVLVTVSAATLACAAVLWWMRPREGRSIRGVRDVGLLGL